MNDKNNRNNINSFVFLIVKMILIYIRMLISIWTIYVYNFLQSFIYYKIRNRLISHIIAFLTLSSIGCIVLFLLMYKYDIDIFNSPYLFMYF